MPYPVQARQELATPAYGDTVTFAVRYFRFPRP